MQAGGDVFPLRVSGWCGRTLHGLGCHGQRQLRPVRDVQEPGLTAEATGVEHRCCGHCWCAVRRAPGGALLEEAEAVAVAPGQIAEPGFLDRGSNGDDLAARRDGEAGADGVNDLRVADL